MLVNHTSAAANRSFSSVVYRWVFIPLVYAVLTRCGGLGRMERRNVFTTRHAFDVFSSLPGREEDPAKIMSSVLWAVAEEPEDHLLLNIQDPNGNLVHVLFDFSDPMGIWMYAVYNPYAPGVEPQAKTAFFEV